MNENEEVDKKLLLKCVEIVMRKRTIPDSYAFSYALELYWFLQDRKLEMRIDFQLPDGRRGFAPYPDMTIPEIIEDYRRLKAKEITDEMIEAQKAANNGNPLEANIKSSDTLFSRLLSKFRLKESPP
jgi:hypothetical protein